jgi:glyoxylase-like metal-dependent hydrolase (beta-lactamase superfamily II)
MNKLNAAITAETVLQHAEKIDVADEWFDVIELPREVYAIAEPGHWQHVISYLIIGAGKSVLFDTGMGISDISAVVKTLTDTEIMVVNSHVHFDHIGDDWRFPEIYLFADEHAVEVLKRGHSHAMLLFDSDPEKFLKRPPSGFDPQNYKIKPVGSEKIQQLADGDVIDLGNRQLEVLHTPGHTNDSLVLFDRENRALFTGDTFYPDALFAFMEGEWGQSDLSAYEKTMQKLTELVPGLDYLYPCHTKPLVDPAMLIDAAKAFHIVNRGKADYKLEEYYFQKMRVYQFDGFEILTLDR